MKSAREILLEVLQSAVDDDSSEDILCEKLRDELSLEELIKKYERLGSYSQMNDKKSQMSTEEMQKYIDSLISENARLKVANDALIEEHYNFNSQLSAQEMFKELGYEREDKYDRIVYYGADGEKVIFYLYDEYYMVACNYGFNYVDIKLHNAIAKQLEELGWL